MSGGAKRGHLHRRVVVRVDESEAELDRSTSNPSASLRT